MFLRVGFVISAAFPIWLFLDKKIVDGFNEQPSLKIYADSTTRSTIKCEALSQERANKSNYGFVCNERDIRPRIYLRNTHWILSNYIQVCFPFTYDLRIHFLLLKRNKKSKCHETITLTTQCTRGYMKDLINLARNWDGFISVAVFSPGYDYDASLREIASLRHCNGIISNKIRDIMSFSIIIPEDHRPEYVLSSLEATNLVPNCSLQLVETDMDPLPSLGKHVHYHF